MPNTPHIPEMTQPVTLSGSHVELIPLAHSQHDALVEAVNDGRLWELWYTTVPSPALMHDDIARRLTLQHAGTMLPFTVVDRASGQIVGMTTYMNVDGQNRRVEIGSTWYAGRVQRTPLNTEAKRLLLEYAFDRLECIAVEFRTHFFNHTSRRAIERLGAKQDGILRCHSIAKDGTLRDTCVYSITAAEWPAVRSHLTWLLSR